MQLLDAAERPVGARHQLAGQPRPAVRSQVHRRTGRGLSGGTRRPRRQRHDDRADSPAAEGSRRNCSRPSAMSGFVGDVIVGRLCGRRAHDATSLAIAMLYNPRLRRAGPGNPGPLEARRKPIARPVASHCAGGPSAARGEPTDWPSGGHSRLAGHPRSVRRLARRRISACGRRDLRRRHRLGVAGQQHPAGAPVDARPSSARTPCPVSTAKCCRCATAARRSSGS